MAVKYSFDPSWYGERDRLRSQSALFDSTTLDWCERCGLRPGAWVLELGAGAGSVAEALAERVAPEGRVVAVDRDTGFLADLADRVEVVQMDILDQPLPAGPFDLVHARMLLAHLLPHTGDPIGLLKSWLEALKPTGWLVLEELDSAGCHESVPASDGFSVVAAGLFAEMERRGVDMRLGLRLPDLLCQAGLQSVEAVSIRPRFRGDPQQGLPTWDLFGAYLAPSMIAAGRITHEQYVEFSRVTHDPKIWVGAPSMTTARGQRPHSAG